MALLGFFAGGFFLNFINSLSGPEYVSGQVHQLFSAGTIPLSNLAILVKVGAGLAGAFLALSAFRRHTDAPDLEPRP